MPASWWSPIAADGREAIAMAERYTPDVVVMMSPCPSSRH